MEHVIEAPDGRKLAVSEGGDADGVPVLVHYGMPNSRLQYGPDVDAATEHGVRMITYDRPGYGGSTAQSGRSVATIGLLPARSRSNPPLRWCIV